MLDINFIRQNPEKVKAVINSGRGKPEKANIDKWLELDKSRSELIQKLNVFQSERNELSKRLSGKPDEATIEKVKTLKESIKEAEDKIKIIEKEWQEILDWVPNMPLSEEDMPIGTGEESNPVIKAWMPNKGYVEGNLGKALDQQNYMAERSIHWDEKLTQPKHHLDLGEALGIIDNKQSALVSGSRFTYLLGDAVLLQYGIQQLVFNELLNRGFTPVIPPLLLKEKSLYGTSHFPESRDQVYQIKGEYVEEGQELNLVGTSEASNFSYYMDKTVKAEDLPIKMFAYTTCFRSEVGSWGKDVKGIKRVHQFDKIEMDVVTSQEQSNAIFEELLSFNEWLLQSLEIPYRLQLKSTGDAGYLASAKQIDPEAWLPGQKEFMEVGTDTNTTDYQARRLNIKYEENGQKKFAHTVNDTGVAMGRMLIAIIDNYQQSDGSIKVPAVLQKFVGKEVIKK